MERQATKAPDYCFRVGGTRKFFVETKRPEPSGKCGRSLVLEKEFPRVQPGRFLSQRVGAALSAYLLDWCVQEEHVATMCRRYSEWEAVVFLQEVEEERAAADAELAKVLKDLGLGNADDKDWSS